MRLSSEPGPCARVDLNGGYAVLKDVQWKNQYLLVPTMRIVGIESPALLREATPNYWQDAWSARDLIERQVGRPIPREDIGLAVNSALGRTQNQLHIHIDCVQPSVRRLLRIHMRRIHPWWSNLEVNLLAHRYRVRWQAGEDLGSANPFRLLAKDRGVRDLGRETLVVVGAVRDHGEPGFVLLHDHANIVQNDLAVGEQLLDHKCKVLAGVPGAG